MTATTPAVSDLLAAAENALWHSDIEHCLALLDDALAVAVTDVDRYGVSEATLRASNGRYGWDLYDLRPSQRVDTLGGVPRWDGRPCDHVVVVAEQGFGDAIQFLRHLPQFAATATQPVTVAVHDELMAILEGAPALAGVTVIAKAQARRTRWPAGTRWERLMSLPIHLPQQSVTATPAYLRAPRATTPKLADSADLTVGVAWRSTPRRGFPNRSMPTHALTHLITTGVRAVALHRSGDIRSLPAGVDDPGIRDFRDTAAVISQCDAVVTVDTVTAHLAPALGVPTIVCLLHRPDWRWGSPRRPTRWYAHAHPLFQGQDGAWRGVTSAAAAAISELLGRTDA